MSELRFRVVTSYGYGNTQAIDLVKKISEIDTNIYDEIVFDFTKFAENKPFNILLIANAINEFCIKNMGKISASIIPKGDNDFLSHLGFYDLINVKFGKKLGEAIANNNYVPITKIKLDGDFYDNIEEQASKLSNLLYFDSDLKEFLKYSFTETIRNVYEHAMTSEVYVCAQKWATKDMVEIAIVDRGRGVAQAMRKKFKDKTELQLMELALMPGVSAQTNHKYLSVDDYWRNSGYGLYALNKLAEKYGGSFIMCSGGVAICKNRHMEKKLSTLFKGTAVSISIKTNTNNDFNQIRKQVILEGQNEAKNISYAIKKASKSSGGI